ncbi:MAG: ABC transporter ATP-binding protein [Xanthobacteraceae bacterium]|nr:ABC transporter ATP-binding protein [Xanthobacteraceae bacterium]
MDDVLRLRKLHAGYGGGAVLQGVDLRVGRAEIVAVLGRNGMGKTTLLKAVMGLLPCTGEILFLGQEIAKLPSHVRARRGLGYVPQGRGLFPSMTVADNIAAGLSIGAIRRSRGDTFKGAIEDLFPIITKRKSQIAGTMSGGEQQQVAIARALIGKPSLLVLDEPSEGIQPSIVQRISEAIRQLNEDHGQAVLIVEQNIEVIAALAQRCYVVENGRVVDEMRVDRTSVKSLQEALSV